MKKLWRPFVALLGAGAMAGALVLAAAGTAQADYGKGALYQVELTANIGGPQGGGVWLWITLNKSGAGDYSGADCGHGEGSVSDKGDVTWQTVGDQVIISGVILNGLGGFPTTITVPAAYGHYSGTVGTFLILPGFIPPDAGFSQLQVAR